MNSICRFIPPKKSNPNLKIIHFVYEMEHKKLKQPFLHTIFYLYLVTRGTGTLTMAGNSYPVEMGSLFFSFPGVEFTLEGSNDLAYMYLSFMGPRAMELIAELQISAGKPLFQGFEEQILFWKRAIQRINPQNGALLSEGVLLHTLSYICDGDETLTQSKNNSALENILAYIDNNFCDPDISIKKVADIYAYTDKYLSHLFKTHMNINWSTYLNRLRIQHAESLISAGETSITKLAQECGYRDPMYFSKVFKRHNGATPRVFIERRKMGDNATLE